MSPPPPEYNAHTNFENTNLRRRVFTFHVYKTSENLLNAVKQEMKHLHFFL